MLLRDLKRVASDCCFNPKKPDKGQRIILDVGNPTYWTVKAMENIRKLQDLAEGSTAYKACLQEATSLLLLTRAFIDEQAEKTKKPKQKTRNNLAGKDNGPTKTP